MDAAIQKTIDVWQEKVAYADLKEELDALIAANDEEKLFDAFYRSLEFGTATSTSWARPPRVSPTT